jgi:hypothetical protein
MHTVIATVRRTVVERYVCELDAPPSDVLDIVYEHFSTFPDSEFALYSRRKIDEETLSTEIIDLDSTVGNDNDGNDEVA